MRGNKLKTSSISIWNKLQRLYELYQVIPILEADKGYDSEELRNKLLKRRIYPFIPRRRMGAAKKLTLRKRSIRRTKSFESQFIQKCSQY